MVISRERRVSIHIPPREGKKRRCTDGFNKPGTFVLDALLRRSGRGEDSLEEHTQWVRNKLRLFNSLLIIR
jgi:hypothetical protein